MRNNWTYIIIFSAFIIGFTLGMYAASDGYVKARNAQATASESTYKTTAFIAEATAVPAAAAPLVHKDTGTLGMGPLDYPLLADRGPKAPATPEGGVPYTFEHGTHKVVKLMDSTLKLMAVLRDSGY